MGGVEEVDFGAVVADAMSAFRSRLLRYQIENDREPPTSVVESAVWDVLFKVLAAGPADCIGQRVQSPKLHFDVGVETLATGPGLMAVNIDAKTEYGEYVLEMLADLGASFT